MSAHAQNELTPIEMKTARLLSIGQSCGEIAWTLGVGEHEVDRLEASIRKKTGCADRLDLWRMVNGCAPWQQDAA